MTIHKAVVFFDNETTGTSYLVDVIEYLGAFWLVPEWIEYPLQKERSPARIISLLTLPHQDTPGAPRFLVKAAIARSVFDGQIPPDKAADYILIDRPEIRLPLPGTTN